MNDFSAFLAIGRCKSLGLIEIIYLICTSTIWGQFPVFLHPEGPLEHCWAAVTDCLMAAHPVSIGSLSSLSRSLSLVLFPASSEKPVCSVSLKIVGSGLWIFYFYSPASSNPHLSCFPVIFFYTVQRLPLAPHQGQTSSSSSLMM